LLIPVLLLPALLISLLLPLQFLLWLLLYLLLNAAYSLWFKHLPLLDIITGFYSRCRVLETGLAVHQAASRIRTAHQFSYWDSLIIASALEGGCTILYSEDMQHGQVIDGRLTVLNPLLEPTLRKGHE